MEADEILFAYGTLGPEGTEPAGFWTPDAVQGRLFDLGPYPVLVDWDDLSAGWVEGHRRRSSLRELVEVLDPYEGTDDGLFRRERLILRSGCSAWVYVFLQRPPATARGPLTRWERPWSRA